MEPWKYLAFWLGMGLVGIGCVWYLGQKLDAIIRLLK